MMTRALVVLSGGQDSTTCLGWALQRYDHVECITFDYGQRHDRELQAACAVVHYYEGCYGRTIPHELLKFPDGILRSTSPLTDRDSPLETYESHEQMAEVIGDRVEKTFVPMRNTLFLTVAANRAVASGCQAVVTGVCQEDNANYPDCRDEFIRDFTRMCDASLGTANGGPGVNVVTPLMHLSKAESVRLALDTPYAYAALAWSHTAYDGQYPPVGRDHASLLRAQGFEEAGRPDPLVLRAVHEGLMAMPTTPNYRDATSFTHAMADTWK